MNKEDEEIVVLKSGMELRKWTENQVNFIHPSVIRCATYSVNYHGISWLNRLAGDSDVAVRLLCDVSQKSMKYLRYAENFSNEHNLEIRVAPVKIGPLLDSPGLFHCKKIILDEVTAVVGSANLTGKALEIGPKPYNIEVSIGLTGVTLYETIKQLVRNFDEWWDESTPLSLADKTKERRKDTMADQEPEYLVFRDRLDWGIAQIQSEGVDSILGEEKWIAASEILPTNPEGRTARIRSPNNELVSKKPQPYKSPAEQLEEAGAKDVRCTRDHFWRLAAYWLQAENRQGQLNHLPVLELRHQTSLVEYLSRADAPREVLIADEVGLGKTVEVGLLLDRLRAANPELRIIYVTPGGLVTNVVDQFRDMGFEDLWVFGNKSLDDQKYPPARLGKKKHDSWVVASLHRLGNRGKWVKVLNETKWDIVIADECHRLRMYGTGDNQNAQQWFRLVESIIKENLSPAGRVYFLSGTPHQGNREVFLNLVSMMCRLGRHASQQDQERTLAGRIIYRTKEEIYDWDDQPVFPKRDVRTPSYAETPPEYNQLLNDIAEYFDQLLRDHFLASLIGDVQANQQRALGFVKSQALQFAASSPKAGFAYLLKRLIRHFDDKVNEKSLLNWVSLLIPYRDWSASQKPEKLLKELRKLVREPEDEEDLGKVVGSTAILREKEKNQLVKLLEQYAKLLSKPESNAKFEVLIKLLLSEDEPFVVFAHSLDTVYEVKRYIESAGLPCYLIVGGQDPYERREVIEQFTEPGHLGRRVVVSSSAGGEGINLQISRRLIHFDLPWNPMVLEQRIGRVHRIGTIDTVIVDTILLKGSREADIYERLRERLLQIVIDLTDDERLRGQYFRRIMAGIPLDTLRELYGGSIATQSDPIGKAVAEGKQHVQQIDSELREYRIENLPMERGRAEMKHLVELLELSKKIKKTSERIEYRKVEFDCNSESFKGVAQFADQFEPLDGRKKDHKKRLVFDREAASRAPSLSRQNSGGIDHPIVSLALQSLRTPNNLDDIEPLALGLGSLDKDYLLCLTGDVVEPVIIISYISAKLSGDYYFDHDIHLYALSESNPSVEKLNRNDGELIEKIIWDNVRNKDSNLICPDLNPELITRLVVNDDRIRNELVDDVRDEEGHWVGAVWPIAVTVLLAK